MRPPSVTRDDLDLAHQLASAGSAAALAHFGPEVEVRTKSDGTPVTAGDLAAEAAILDLLRERRPDDGILSEESGASGSGRSRRRWLIDPIDGTASFLAGEQNWGTHIALEIDGVLVVGIITRPVERRRWWAVAGGGAWVSDDAEGQAAEGRIDGGTTRLGVSATPHLADSRIGFFTAPPTVDALVEALTPHVAELVPASGTNLAALLVGGEIDGIVSYHSGFAWDHAPGVVLVGEAGGRFTDPLGGAAVDRRGGVYSNGLVHDALVSAVATIG